MAARREDLLEGQLRKCAEAGDVEQIEILLDPHSQYTRIKINIDAQDPDTQMTALHLASKQGREQVVRQLLKANAKHVLQDKEGKTPLHHAVSGGHLGTVRLLVEAGANYLAEDKAKTTPFSIAEMGQTAEQKSIKKFFDEIIKLKPAQAAHYHDVHYSLIRENLESSPKIYEQKLDGRKLQEKITFLGSEFLKMQSEIEQILQKFTTYLIPFVKSFSPGERDEFANKVDRFIVRFNQCNMEYHFVCLKKEIKLSSLTYMMIELIKLLDEYDGLMSDVQKYGDKAKAKKTKAYIKKIKSTINEFFEKFKRNLNDLFETSDKFENFIRKFFPGELSDLICLSVFYKKEKGLGKEELQKATRIADEKIFQILSNYYMEIITSKIQTLKKSRPSRNLENMMFGESVDSTSQDINDFLMLKAIREKYFSMLNQFRAWGLRDGLLACYTYAENGSKKFDEFIEMRTTLSQGVLDKGVQNRQMEFMSLNAAPIQTQTPEQASVLQNDKKIQKERERQNRLAAQSARATQEQLLLLQQAQSEDRKARDEEKENWIKQFFSKIEVGSTEAKLLERILEGGIDIPRVSFLAWVVKLEIPGYEDINRKQMTIKNGTLVLNFGKDKVFTLHPPHQINEKNIIAENLQHLRKIFDSFGITKDNFNQYMDKYGMVKAKAKQAVKAGQ